MALRSGLKIVSAGAVIGISGYYYRLRQNRVISAEEVHDLQAKQIEALKRKGSNGLVHQEVKLFRYATCPFCSVAQTFLEYYGVPHTVVEVGAMMKSEIKENAAFTNPNPPYTKVPQVTIGEHPEGVLLVDSEGITDTLRTVIGIPGDTPEARRWREWARKTFSLLVVINMNKTLSSSIFDVKMDAPPLKDMAFHEKIFLQYFGGSIMYLVSRFVTKKRLITQGFNVNNESEAMEKGITMWLEEGVGSRPFHGGNKPDQADLDVYGIARSLKGTHPLYEQLAETRLGPWMERMEREVGSGGGRSWLRQ